MSKTIPKERVIHLIEKYNTRVLHLISESKQIDVFYKKNTAKYRKDKACVTNKLEELLQVVQDLEGLLI